MAQEKKVSEDHLESLTHFSLHSDAKTCSLHGHGFWPSLSLLSPATAGLKHKRRIHNVKSLKTFIGKAIREIGHQVVHGQRRLTFHATIQHGQASHLKRSQLQHILTKELAVVIKKEFWAIILTLPAILLDGLQTSR